MAQPSVASFFNTRKRAAAEDVACIKNRRILELNEASYISPSSTSTSQLDDDISSINSGVADVGMRTRSSRIVKRTGMQQMEPVPRKMVKKDSDIQQKKLVQFIKKGPLSPRKLVTCTVNMQKVNEETPKSNITASSILSTKSKAAQMEELMKTPTKQIIKGGACVKSSGLKNLVKKELNFDEVKTKITRSEKLQELKASLGRIQELEKARQEQEERNRRLREGISPVRATQPIVQLKEFGTIELEVLTSPAKTFKTPTKLPPPTPDKNELMSPRHTDVSKRVLFSPAKCGSPSKMIVAPAYQRFMSLVESSTAGQLPLPYKYRHLIEIFKGLDSVCAMFHNRKECITFKKLKPAVQRMLRKNFNENHLAQIKHVFPEAFNFMQTKTRNFGSTSKADYFQLVITPNVEQPVALINAHKTIEVDEDNLLMNAQGNCMNPQVMIERLQRFQRLLLLRVHDEHDKFLKSLDPPLIIPKQKVTRWHPDFELENCAEIELGHLPQPPNVEKYSSARDILSTARNLFNCATPMERAMQRYEAKMEADRLETQTADIKKHNIKSAGGSISMRTHEDTTITKSGASKRVISIGPTVCIPQKPTVEEPDVAATLLKGVPKSLLEKIRAKQAAKALDTMTRRPSQDQEATKYSRLPELARHLRNMFITERKGVLTLEVVIKKIQNSFRTCLTPQEIESHLRLIAKEVPNWIGFHEVRKTMYLKMAKDMELGKVIATLEHIANEKSK